MILRRNDSIEFIADRIRVGLIARMCELILIIVGIRSRPSKNFNYFKEAAMKVKLSSPFRSMQPLLLISTCAVALLSTSCSTLAPKQEAMSEEEICTRLDELIKAHPDKFVGYRKNKHVTRRMTIWDATVRFPEADDCQVWEWSSGLYNYFCEWKADDMDDAQADFHRAEGILERCLGLQWTRHENPTASGGQHTRFIQEGSRTVVSVRYFKDQYWQTVLYIGDRSNLNTPLQ